jgi:long-subunit fatty acid transport protein
MISVAVGGRFITAKETYSGHLKDVQINLGGTWMPATTYFTNAATQYTTYATQFTTAATNLQNAITGGMIGANDPLADLVAIGTLTALGLYSTGMTNSQAVAAFTGAATSATVGAAKAGAAATALADQEVDAEKTATGITPVVSVNISPIDMINIALKYEFKTNLEFTTAVASDKRGLTGFDASGNPVYMFTDGEKKHLDIPAMLSAGVMLKPIDKIQVSGGFHYYFDKNANWEGREEQLDRGLYEIALGAQYKLIGPLEVSAGWLMTSTGATEAYQTDQSYSLNTNTFGGGLGFSITDMIELNLAGSYTIYQEGASSFTRELGGEGQSGVFNNLQETYNKSTWIVAVGLDIAIAK